MNIHAPLQQATPNAAASSSGRAEPARLRLPIYLQLLLPIVGLSVMAVVVSAATTAGWLALRVRFEQRESMRGLAQALADARFPLTQHVLSQLHEFTGAEFVLFDERSRISATTLSPLSETNRRTIEQLIEQPLQSLSLRLPPTTADSVSAVEEYFVDRVKLSSPPGPAKGTLFVLHPHQRVTHRMLAAGVPAVVVGAAAVLLSISASVWMARRMVRPVHTIREQAARIAQGDFAPMPIDRPNDELRDLCEAINRMAVQLSQYEDAVRRNERMETLGRLGAALAHQLRNAAAGSRLAIELHARQCPPEKSDSLNVALRQLSVIETYLQRFLGLGQIAPPCGTAVDIRRSLDEAAALLHPLTAHHGVLIEIAALDQPLMIAADAEAVRQLIVNLAGNAIEAAQTVPDRGGRVWLSIAREGDQGVLTVADNGPGPPEEIAARLFEPFASAKTGGIGLGLWVARQIAEAYGGSLTWRRDAGRTFFEFRFPLSDRATRLPDERSPADARNHR